MTPYQVSSEIYGGFFYPGITLNSGSTFIFAILLDRLAGDGVVCPQRFFVCFGLVLFLLLLVYFFLQVFIFILPLAFWLVRKYFACELVELKTK